MKIARAFALSSLLLVAFCMATLTRTAFAQTDGTAQGGGFWSTIPWVITSGPGSYPTDGGVATFAQGNADVNYVYMDVPVTLSGLTIDSPFSYAIEETVPNSIVLANDGATFQISGHHISDRFTLISGQLVDATITGGGSSGLTVTGGGKLVLRGTNTYTGGTHIDGGELIILSDANLGATGAGNGLSFNGGSLVSAQPLVTSREITLGPGGGTLLPSGTMTLGGAISGSGSLTVQTFLSGVTLTADNTYTGYTNFFNNGTVTLSGNGRIGNSHGLEFGGTVVLDNAATNNADRLGDGITIDSYGVEIKLIGNASTATEEIAGSMYIGGGTTTLTVTPNAAQHASLTLPSIFQTGVGVLFVRGTSLGAAPANGVANVFINGLPLIGGGGAANTTNISIVPWGVGNVSATATSGYSFITSDNTSGVRPLNASEYATEFTNPDDNVRITANKTVGPVTTNALLLAPTTGIQLQGGPIQITSGAFLLSGTGGSATVNAALDFGLEKGHITASRALTLNGAISGSNGVAFDSLTTNTITIAGANTYTGTTALLGGTIHFAGLVAADGTPGPFGEDISAIRLQPGSSRLSLVPTSASTINRPLRVEGSGFGDVQLGFGAADFQLVVNGGIALLRDLAVLGGSDESGAVILNGAVSGTGSLSSSSFTVLNNPINDFGGGINVLGGTFVAGADHVFGLGPIVFTATGTIRSADTTPHTLDNAILLKSDAIFGGAGSLTFNGELDLNGTRTIEVSTASPATIAFAGEIKSGSFTKTGTGTLALTGTSTYAGGTTVLDGTLLPGSVNALGTGPVVVAGGTLDLQGGIAIPNTIIVNGGTLAARQRSDALISGWVSDAKLIVAAGGTAAFSVGTDGFSAADLDSLKSIGTGSTGFLPGSILGIDTSNVAGGTFTYGSDIADTNSGLNALSLSKLGTDTLTLTGNNTYTGGTTVFDGILIPGSVNALGTGPVVVKGGTLQLQAGISIPNAITLVGGALALQVNAGTDFVSLGNFTGDISGGTPTIARILGGTASTPANLQSSFGATSPAENDDTRQSSIFTLSGIPVVNISTGETDVFVLQLQIPNVTSDSFLGWYNPATMQWVNAVDGNFGGVGSFVGDRAYDSGTDFHLGNYGVNTSGGTVWAVLNHNSDFAINALVAVPEPSTYGIALTALLGGLILQRRRRTL